MTPGAINNSAGQLVLPGIQGKMNTSKTPLLNRQSLTHPLLYTTSTYECPNSRKRQGKIGKRPVGSVHGKRTQVRHPQKHERHDPATSNTEPPPCAAGEWNDCRCVGQEHEPMTVENVGDLTVPRYAGCIVDHKPRLLRVNGWHWGQTD